MVIVDLVGKRWRDQHLRQVNTQGRRSILVGIQTGQIGAQYTGGNGGVEGQLGSPAQLPTTGPNASV